VSPSPRAYRRQRRAIDQNALWRIAESLQLVSPNRDIHVGIVVGKMMASMDGLGVKGASRDGVFHQSPTIPGTREEAVAARDPM
jgi:hypothetical protein